MKKILTGFLIVMIGIFVSGAAWFGLPPNGAFTELTATILKFTSSAFSIYNSGDAGIMTGNVTVEGTVTAESYTSSGTDQRMTLDSIYMDGNDNGTAGVMRMGATGLGNNEALDYDFNSVSNTVTVTSPTGITSIIYSGISLTYAGQSGATATKVPINSGISSGNMYKDFYYDDTFLDDEEFLTEPFLNMSNLLTNTMESTFSDTVIADIKLPDAVWGLHAMDDDGAGGDSCERSSTQAKTGTYSTHLTVDDLNEGMKRAITVTSGHWVRVSYWYYIVSGTLETIIQKNGVNFQYYKNYDPLNTAGSWRLATFDFYKESDGTTSFMIYLYSASAGMECYIDDIVIADLGTTADISNGFGSISVSGVSGIEGANFVFGETQTVLENCEDAWDEQVIANVTSTADGTIFKLGTNSAKFVVDAAFTTGIVGTEAISSTNFRNFDLISMWVYSTVALNSGDYKFIVDNTANCASPIDPSTRSFKSIPANEWTQVFLNLSALRTSDYTSVAYIGIHQLVDKGAMTIYIDDVRGLSYGNVALAGNTTNVVITDTDNKLCVFKKVDAYAGTVTPFIRNRMGESKEMRCEITYN